MNRQGGKRRQSVNEEDEVRSYRRCDEISDGEAERECLSELARERGDDRDECRIPSDRSALIGMWLARARVQDDQRVQICGGTKLRSVAIQCKRRRVRQRSTGYRRSGTGPAYSCVGGNDAKRIPNRALRRGDRRAHNWPMILWMRMGSIAAKTTRTSRWASCARESWFTSAAPGRTNKWGADSIAHRRRQQ